MKIIKRTGSHFREAAGGMVLIATHVAGQPSQFPPVEFVHNDQPVEEIELGPTGALYSYTVVHPGKDKPPYGLAMVDFAPGGPLCGGLCTPTWVTVAGPGCKGGDSGAPVFLGGRAFGIVKGGSYRADGSCGFYFYMSTDYLPDGWRLLGDPAAPAALPVPPAPRPL